MTKGTQAKSAAFVTCIHSGSVPEEVCVLCGERLSSWFRVDVWTWDDLKRNGFEFDREEIWCRNCLTAEDLAGRLRNGPAPYRKKEVGG